MECLAGGSLKDIKEGIQFGEAQIKYMYVLYTFKEIDFNRL